MSKLLTIAFDLGGVIFSVDNNIFADNYIETELTEGIYDLLMYLHKKTNVKLIVISKAFPNNAKKSKEILKMYGLDDIFNSIIFCEFNSKKALIAKAMDVNIMIDDKKEVLECFDKSIKTILFDSNKIGDLYKLV
jgi:FMN phosphatase YigB (HAD superfamily)|tara:strand:+ start:184 stop:588 length:405 start_codon:yes stop_codon:yes gene_type:complete